MTALKVVVVALLVIGALLIWLGRRIENGKGSADERVGAVIPYIGAFVCFAVSFLIVLIKVVFL